MFPSHDLTEVDSEIQDDEQIEEETGIKQEDLSSDVPELLEEQGNLMLEHLSGEIIDEDWEITDVRDVCDDNVSDEEWVSASIVNKETTLSKIKKLVGLSEPIESKNNGSSYSDLDSKNYKIRYQYYQKSKAKSIQKDKNGKRKSEYKSRDFCEKMMELSRKGTVYTIEDIDKASRAGVNGGFAPAGKRHTICLNTKVVVIVDTLGSRYCTEEKVVQKSAKI